LRRKKLQESQRKEKLLRKENNFFSNLSTVYVDRVLDWKINCQIVMRYAIAKFVIVSLSSYDKFSVLLILRQAQDDNTII